MEPRNNTCRDKDTVRAYPELMAMAGIAINSGGCDFFDEAGFDPGAHMLVNAMT